MKEKDEKKENLKNEKETNKTVRNNSKKIEESKNKSQNSAKSSETKETKVIETKLGKIEYKETNKPKTEDKPSKSKEEKVSKETSTTKSENKLKDSPKTKIKKEKKSKKWLLVVILLIILIVLALMVLYTSITPRSSVNNLLTNLTNGNKFMAGLNIDDDELISVLDSTIALEGGSSMSNLEKECFNELSWEITGESVENTNATVTATITTKNFRQVLLNWIEKISEVLEAQDDIDTAQNLQLLEESLVQDNVDTRTNEVTINLERRGLTWKVVINDEFIDAIYPGMTQVLDVMEQLSNELQQENAQTDAQ